MSDAAAITCIVCGKACPLDHDGLCPRCVADTVPQVGAVDWSYREPSRMSGEHRDSPIMLDGRLHWQQDQAPHVPGSAYRSDPGHRTVSREISEQKAAKVNAALDALTPGQRDVMALKLAGHTHAAIASALGMPLVTVDERVRRGRDALRRNAPRDGDGLEHDMKRDRRGGA